MWRCVPGFPRRELSGAVGAENGQVGKTLAQHHQVTVFAAVEERAAPDTGEHQRADGGLDLEPGDGGAHFGLGRRRLPRGPGQVLAAAHPFRDGDRVFGGGVDHRHDAVAAPDARITRRLGVE